MDSELFFNKNSTSNPQSNYLRKLISFKSNGIETPTISNNDTILESDRFIKN
jgi:hypothetical protein